MSFTENIMFRWGVLKCGVPESVHFCIGDLPKHNNFDTDPSLLTNVHEQ